MKVCVSALGDNLEAQVDPRFGRAQFFIIIDTETMNFEAVSNTGINAAHGAGIQSGQLISSYDVTAVITGNVGPNAFQTLTAGGIKIYQAKASSVKQAIEAFKNDQLQLLTQIGPAHAGTMGMGAGMGGGMGRGMGGGMGRGMGMGAGAAIPPASSQPTAPAPTSMTKEQEIQYLKTQLETLAQQLEAINQRINELKKA